MKKEEKKKSKTYRAAAFTAGLGATGLAATIGAKHVANKFHKAQVRRARIVAGVTTAGFLAEMALMAAAARAAARQARRSGASQGRRAGSSYGHYSGAGFGRSTPHIKHFHTLDLSGKETTKAQVKKKYRDAAFKHHPDRGGNEEKMKEVSNAYSEIKNSPWHQKLAYLKEDGMNSFWDGFEKRASGWGTAAELGGLGVLAVPSIQKLRGHPMDEDTAAKMEILGLGTLAAPYLGSMARTGAGKAWSKLGPKVVPKAEKGMKGFFKKHIQPHMKG